MCWHLPIVPGRLQPSIFGTNELNFCVRYGNRWTLIVINTNYSVCPVSGDFYILSHLKRKCKLFLFFYIIFFKINKKQIPYWVPAFMCWHLPIVPGRLQPSIFGTNELNFCVRYGNRWTLIVINTNYFIYMISHSRVFIPLVTRRGIEPLFSA